jgi:N-methylhydantoinase B/oxoprolinase/acetone carboxylase alpha subunit
MPPNSTSLLQEGAQFVSFKIVDQGQLKEKGERIIARMKNIFFIKELIDRLNEPGKLENCSGTRTLMHNIADLKAQIAANLKVIYLAQNFSLILFFYLTSGC